MDRAVLRVIARFAFLGPLLGCGYRPLYGGDPASRSDSLAVVGASSLAADASVVAEVEAGVRAELSRAGQLAGGSGYPRIVVEVLRIDSQSEGIAASGTTPLARGTRASVVARAWVERTAGAAHERDTGDLRATDLMAIEADPRLEALRSDDATRAAARRLGERLARGVMGEPIARDDGL